MELTFEELSLFLFSELKLDRSSTDDFRYRFNSILTFFASYKLILSKDTLTKPNVNRFLDWGEKVKKWSPANLNKFIVAFKYMCKYYELDILEDYKPYKRTAPVIDPLSPKEIQQLAKTHVLYKKKSKEQNYRFKVVIYALALTGMRVSELINLTWNDYIDQTFIVRDSKTNTARKVPVANKLKELMENLPRYNHNYVFGGYSGRLKPDTINGTLKMKASTLGLRKRVYAHIFRHSFITESLRNGMAIEKVAKIVGHEDLKTTMNYEHLLVDDLRVVVDSHPLALEDMKLQQIKELIVKLKEHISATKFKKILIEEENKITLIVENLTAIDK